jgi:hypothetical protein
MGVLNPFISCRCKNHDGKLVLTMGVGERKLSFCFFRALSLHGSGKSLRKTLMGASAPSTKCSEWVGLVLNPFVSTNFQGEAQKRRNLEGNLPNRTIIVAQMPASSYVLVRKAFEASVGAWPSGKAPVFGIGMRRFESCRPSHFLNS